MTQSPERQEQPQVFSNGTDPAIDPPATSKAAVPPSPAQSDKSSESEGRPVREKLKETRIDAQTSSEVPSSDLPMDDARNGTDHTGTTSGDQSISGSDSERGRLRRKRSRENFEADEVQVDKKKEHERHVRKKSRDVTSPKPENAPNSPRPTKAAVEPIDEDDADQTMQSVEGSGSSQPQASRPDQPATPEATMTDDDAANIISPKNKRTRDQADSGEVAAVLASADKEAGAVTKVEEPNPKRPRDKSELQSAPEKAVSETKIPPGSGFTNTSVTSPFASLTKSPSPQVSAKPTQELPHTSDDKFKSSGFSSFTSSASPFGGLGNPSSSSPFATGGTGKLTSFASSASASKPTGFAGISGATGKSVFGGGSATTLGGSSGFGGTLGGGGGFGGLGSSKPGTFAAPGATGITGLSSKPAKPFGAATKPESDSEEADGDDEDNTGDGYAAEDHVDKRFKIVEVETGEEHEEVVWAGRAKLFTLDREKKQWQERGLGPFKFNVTKAEPKKARFIIRADGTHRLLLNAAVTKDMLFGDPAGKKPTDGKASFSAPAADGKGVDMHILRMKPENAQRLHEAVEAFKDSV